MTNKKRLPLFIWKGMRKGPMVSLVGRLLIATVYSLVIIAVISVALGSWGPFVATPLPILASYLFWRPRYRIL
jgi:predicted membrane chloride channel (bestrophin family)